MLAQKFPSLEEMKQSISTFSSPLNAFNQQQKRKIPL
jgi:hypothetical protein